MNRKALHTKRMTAVGILCGLTILLVAVAGRAQEQLDARVLAYDKGPAKIDVSKYPPEMQAAYKVYAAKCGKCHTLARAVNCDFVLEDEWERYVKRMMRKAGSFITAADGKAIYEFVVYDSKVRRKDLYDRKLKEAGKPPGP